MSYKLLRMGHEFSLVCMGAAVAKEWWWWAGAFALAAAVLANVKEKP